MFRWIAAGLMAFVASALITGCATSEKLTSPVIPSFIAEAETAMDSPSQVLWGLWDVTFDPESGEFNLVPLRGAMFQVNVTRFLQPPDSPVHLLHINFDSGASDLPSGYVVCDVSLRHPFPGHPRFRGFDVRGIVMGDASLPGYGDSGELLPRQDELRILNADGYTRWWNPTEFTSYGTIFGYTEGALAPKGYYATGTINGYKYFADGLVADAPLGDMDLSMRGTFGVDPGVNVRRYELQFPLPGGVPDFHFNYAITAGYAGPTTHDFPDYPVHVFPISANMAEAFRIDVVDAGSTAYYENPSTYGGDLNLLIEVFDWGFLETSVVTDELALVPVWSPTLFNGAQGADLGSGIPGGSGCSFVFPITVANVTPTSVAGQELVVLVRSVRPWDYAPDIPGVTGFDYPEDAILTAYKIWEVPISPIGPQDNHPPEVGVIDGPRSLFPDEDGVYTLSYAFDLEDGGDLTLLWDNDGNLDFADDLDGDDANLEAVLNFPANGIYYVIARALDSGGLWTDSEPFAVDVGPCPTEIHKSWVPCRLGDAPPFNFSRMDAAFQAVGDYAGYLLVQNTFNSIRAYDVTQPTPWIGEPYMALVSPSDETLAYSIDVDDHSGRVVVALMDSFPDDILDPSEFQVYDVDGTYLASFSVGRFREVCEIDTDENGDIWVASWEDWHDSGQGHTAQFQHFEFLDEAPYYIEATEDECDITDQFDGNNQMMDFAISYTLDRIYALRSSAYVGPDPPPYAPHGEIYCWDMAPDGTLTLNDTIQDLDVFPERINGAMVWKRGGVVDGKIEIDHPDEESEFCRIVIMARQLFNGHYFTVMDSDLNKIDLVLATPPARRYCFALGTDPEPANQPLFTSGYTSGEVYLAPAPPGW